MQTNNKIGIWGLKNKKSSAGKKATPKQNSPKTKKKSKKTQPEPIENTIWGKELIAEFSDNNISIDPISTPDHKEKPKKPKPKKAPKEIIAYSLLQEKYQLLKKLKKKAKKKFKASKKAVTKAKKTNKKTERLLALKLKKKLAKKELKVIKREMANIKSTINKAFLKIKP